MIPVSFFALGAILASFVGVMAGRVHTGQSWLSGRSRCDSCGVDLSAVDLIPVVSWIRTLGRCRTCHSKIGTSHVVSEVMLGTLFVLAYSQLGLVWELVPFLLALVIITFIVVYDLRHTVIPLYANVVLVGVALVFAYLAAPGMTAFGGALLSAGFIGLAFFLLYALSRGRAMGLGDTPFAFSMALLAAPYAFGGLLLSFWIGAAYGIVVLLGRRGGPTMGIEVPFAPFLALGFILAFFLAWNPLLPLY